MSTCRPPGAHPGDRSAVPGRRGRRGRTVRLTCCTGAGTRLSPPERHHGAVVPAWRRGPTGRVLRWPGVEPWRLTRATMTVCLLPSPSPRSASANRWETRAPRPPDPCRTRTGRSTVDGIEGSWAAISAPRPAEHAPSPLRPAETCSGRSSKSRATSMPETSARRRSTIAGLRVERPVSPSTSAARSPTLTADSPPTVCLDS